MFVCLERFIKKEEERKDKKVIEFGGFRWV